MADWIKIESRVDFSDLKAGLASLNHEVSTRAGYAAASAGARVVQRKAVELASTIPSGAAPGLRDTGALIRNIAIARRPVERTGSYFPYHVGVRSGSKKQRKSGNDPWYWKLLEFGWTSRGGRSFRYPFLGPAVQASPQAVLAAMHASLRRSLARAMRGRR